MVLWYLYMQYEVSKGCFERAKALFWRAIRECPWSKGKRTKLSIGFKIHQNLPPSFSQSKFLSDFYKFAATNLMEVLSVEEFEQIMSLMEEKEVRVRVRLE